jgi:Bifunctional DNA primase/polymerase, N-terminal/Primase C terminal 1 (PriCT-1)
MVGIFSRWQPLYAQHGIATFPVKIEGKDKKPMNQGYQRTGLSGSAELGKKFTEAQAIGMILGARNKIELVDVDTKDERALADALSTYGDTPIICCTASGGGFHAWYRYSDGAWKNHGKGRRAIRPDRTRPFDFLAAGMAVAPPSIGPLGRYEFIRGGLDDIEALKPLARPVPAKQHEGDGIAAAIPGLPVAEGSRNTRTWRYAMRVAKSAITFDHLVGEIIAFNERSLPPLEKEEVMTICDSAWAYTQNNQNRFGQHGAYFPTDEVVSMLRDQDAFVLLAFLRAKQGPWNTFMVANGLTEVLHWTRKRVAAARTRLIQMGYIVPVRQAGKGVPALFKWAE